MQKPTKRLGQLRITRAADWMPAKDERGIPTTTLRMVAISNGSVGLIEEDTQICKAAGTMSSYLFVVYGRRHFRITVVQDPFVGVVFFRSQAVNLTEPIEGQLLQPIDAHISLSITSRGDKRIDITKISVFSD